MLVDDLHGLAGFLCQWKSCTGYSFGNYITVIIIIIVEVNIIFIIIAVPTSNIVDTSNENT